MSKATSFISEHSAEYILIPALQRILHRRFEFVIPIYPWVSREGGKIARELHRHDSFKVVGLYPRRPKLMSAESSKTIVTINDQILLGAQSGIQLGIPIIAGCPLGKSLWEFGNNPTCFWIKLNQGAVEGYELDLEHITPKDCFISEEELLSYLIENMDFVNYISMIAAFTDIRRTYSWFIFGGGYKPVYFLLK